MATQLTPRLGASNRQWLVIRGGTNPFSAVGGPLPQITVPLEARVTERGISVDLLRLDIDLKLGNILVGHGELGPCTHLGINENYLVARILCPQAALAYLINPPPPQGRITLTLTVKGLLRYRHTFHPGTDDAHGLDESEVWHTDSIGDQGGTDLEVQVARSDWYEQVVQQLDVGSYLIMPISLPRGVKTWDATLGHMDEALRALVQGNPPGVFGACRAAIDALPGNKTSIFDAMPEGKKRDAIDELTKAVGKYVHSGRHVVPNTGGDLAGEFPVDQRDALFIYNTTKLLLSHIASLTLAP